MKPFQVIPAAAGDHNPNVPMPQALQNYLNQLLSNANKYGQAVMNFAPGAVDPKVVSGLLDTYAVIQENISTLQDRLSSLPPENKAMVQELNRDIDAVAKQVQVFCEGVARVAPAGSSGLGALVPRSLSGITDGKPWLPWLFLISLLGGSWYFYSTRHKRRGTKRGVGNIIEV